MKHLTYTESTQILGGAAQYKVVTEHQVTGCPIECIEAYLASDFSKQPQTYDKFLDNISEFCAKNKFKLTSLHMTSEEINVSVTSI